MIKIQGIGASKGVAIGQALLMQQDKINVEKESITSVSEEIARLDQASQVGANQLKELEKYAQEHVGKEEAMIFEVHQMMITDGELTDRAKEIIKEDNVTAQYAMQATSLEYSNIFKQMDDPYMQGRAVDIEDVSARIIRVLMGIKEKNLSNLKEPIILVANDLLPSDTVKMDKKNILGIITEKGSEMSHSSILARTMQIPAIVGIEGVLSKIQDGDEIVLDGKDGNLFINPDNNIKQQWLKQQELDHKKRDNLKKLKGTKSITKDGVEIKINGNIGAPEDADAVLENDGEGVGLFRSEFLYMNSNTMPNEESQFEAYKVVLEKMGDKKVIIRTLDVGGDKEIPYLEIPKEDNPFLGYRGIRICLDQVGIFKTQLRALLRASVYGNLGIMFPMISTLEELRQAKKIVEDVKKELTQEEIPFSPNIEVGIMVETPASAMISDILAKESDFFSIGTNDLTQYTIAVDRMNAKVAHLYDTHHPAVLKLIALTIENGHKENISVGICGEAAADPTLTETFIKMGIDELSVSPGSVLEIREKIQGISQS